MPESFREIKKIGPKQEANVKTDITVAVEDHVSLDAPCVEEGHHCAGCFHCLGTATYANA